jgi:hypothetical protein
MSLADWFGNEGVDNRFGLLARSPGHTNEMVVTSNKRCAGTAQ